MSVSHTPWYMSKQVGGYEKGIKDSAAAVETDERELVIQSYALRSMIRQWQAKKQEACQQSESTAEDLYGERFDR